MLKSIKVFQEVAKARSFSKAAERTGITAAMASRYVKNIEDQIGARLLNRTSRTVSLTEAGEIYLGRVTPVLEDLEEASIVANQSTVEPRGLLKIRMPAMMSTPIFSHVIALYRENYKEVTLYFDISSDSANIIQDGYDLALHVGDVAAEGLIAKKLADVRSFIVASPDLLAKSGRPASVADIEALPFLLHSGMTARNKIRCRNGGEVDEVKVNPVLKTENEMMILHAVLEGVGAALLPEWLVAPAIKNGTLQTLLPETISNTRPLYILYPDRTYLPAKTRTFIDFISSFEEEDLRYPHSIVQT